MRDRRPPSRFHVIDRQSAPLFTTLEKTGLFLLILMLPIMETPKQAAFYLAAIGTSGSLLFGTRSIRFRTPDSVEWILLAMLSACLASTLANWPIVHGFKGFRDTSCFLFLFLIMYHCKWPPAFLNRLLAFFSAGVLSAALFGIWQWHAGKTPHLEFHSVGVVTQSAAYAVMSIFIFAGVFLDTETGFSQGIKKAAAACAVFMFVVLMLMGSRGGILSFAVGAVCLLAVFHKIQAFRALLFLCGLTFFVAVSTAAINFRECPILERIRHLSANIGERGFTLDKDFPFNDMLRIEHWRLGLKQATESDQRIFGIGPRNFHMIDVESYSFEPPLKTYPRLWTRPNHAHNLFLTKWAEEGVLGLASFLLFFLWAARRLVLCRPAPGSISWIWIAAVGALVAPLTTGMFNSPFKNENAWLSMMLLGLATGWSHGLGSGKRDSAAK